MCEVAEGNLSAARRDPAPLFILSAPDSRERKEWSEAE